MLATSTVESTSFTESSPSPIKPTDNSLPITIQQQQQQQVGTSLLMHSSFGIHRRHSDDVTSTSFTATTTQTLTKVKDGTDGVDGDAAGIVYAGNWAIGTTNDSYDDPTEYLSGDLKYVVKYNNIYYTTEVQHYYRGTFVQNTQDYDVNDIVHYQVLTT